MTFRDRHLTERTRRLAAAIGSALLITGLTFAQSNPSAVQPLRKISPGSASLLREKLPMSFEANEGQIDGEVQFLARGRGYALFLTSTQAVLSLRDSRAGSKPGRKASRDRLDIHPRAKLEAGATRVLRMNLRGANLQPEPKGLDRLPGIVNRFVGANPKQWHTEIETFSKISYHEVYSGIDLVYYGREGQLEFDFVVGPGARPEAIQLHFEGADGLEIDPAGGLVVRLDGQTVRWPKPLVYQLVEGAKKEIEGNYVLNAKQEVGFKLSAYDRAQPLVIDPVLIYSSYLGGSDFDAAEAVAVDGTGNLYVTGETLSLNFPRAGTSRASAGSYDLFVTKVNAGGSAFVYSTYIGGRGDDLGQGIAVDANGNAYVTGLTDSDNFPTVNASQSSIGSAFVADAFVVKLGSSGSLVYSTYFGGPDIESGNAIAVDGSGNAYVTGETVSGPQFPKKGPFQNNAGGGIDAFVAKFNASGSVAYASWLGGRDDDRGTAIAVDASGNAYVCGEVFSLDSLSSSFPVVNALQPVYGGGDSDAFVVKINPSGSSVLFATFLGGEDSDSGFGLALDSGNNIYVTGSTRSIGFPTTRNAQQPGIAEPDFFTTDAFVSKIQSNGASLLYSTYLGGSLDDSAAAVAVDSSGAIYLTGETESDDFPVTTGADQSDYGGFGAFVSKLNPAAPGPSGIIYSSYFGGTGFAQGTDIAVDKSGNFYVCGLCDSTDLPTTGAAQRAFGGGVDDAFVAKFFSPADLSVSILASTNLISVGNNLTYTLTVNNNWRTTFTGVSLTNILPPGVQFISMTNSRGTCANAGGRITCNFGTMASNASATVTIVVRPPTPGDITDTAMVVANESDINTDNNNPSVTTTVRGIADLAVSQVDLPDPVFVGSNLTYLITVTNRGPWPATQVLLTNLTPLNLKFLNSTQSQGYVEADFFITNLYYFYLVDDLAVNARATIAVFFSAVTPGAGINQLGVSGFEFDPNLANNVSAITTTVNPLADLVLSGTVSPPAVYVSSNLTYTLTVSNKGPSTATAVVLTNRLPAGVTFLSARPGSGCTVAGSVVTCSLGSLNAGAATTVFIDASATAQGVLSNVSSVGSGVADSIPADNAITLTNTALPLADLAVTVLDAPDPVLLGSNLVYTLTVTNRGPSTALNIMLSDILLGPANFLSVTPSQGTYTLAGNVVTCSLGSISNRANARVTIMVNTTSAGLITNLVSASTTITDPNLANNSASTVTKVNSPPFISTLADQIINEDTSTGPLGFTIRDLETAASALVFTARSSNPGLVANSSLVYGGSGSNRTLSIFPLTNQFGAATISVQVSDADGATNRTSFLLTVNSVNDAPTLSPISDLTIFKSSGAQIVNLTGISDGPTNETQVLTIAAISSQPSLIPNPTVNYTNPSPTGTLVLTHAANMTGSATITVTVQDNGGTANGGQNSINRSFLVTVIDSPTLHIRRTNNVVVLSWPTNAVGFHLDSRTNLASSTSWTAVTNAPVVKAGQFTVTNSLGSGRRFYRLH